MSYAIRLDFPPSVNTYWRMGKRGMYLAAPGRKYKAHAQLSWGLVHTKSEPLHGRLGVQIELAAPNVRRDSDIDNRIKAVLDALQGAAFEDDHQVDYLIVKRLPIDLGGDGYADVIVSELSPPSEA